MIDKKDTSEYSLLDYLGRSAGPELGLKVSAAAREAGIKPTHREVYTRKYVGKILVYPKYFLDAYFILNPKHR